MLSEAQRKILEQLRSGHWIAASLLYRRAWPSGPALYKRGLVGRCWTNFGWEYQITNKGRRALAEKEENAV